MSSVPIEFKRLRCLPSVVLPAAKESLVSTVASQYTHSCVKTNNIQTLKNLPQTSKRRIRKKMKRSREPERKGTIVAAAYFASALV